MHDENATPKILIVVPNYWGKAKTISGAWKQVAKQSCKTIRELKRGYYSIYFGYDTKSVPLWVNHMGNVEYHSDHPFHQIEKHSPKPKK